MLFLIQKVGNCIKSRINNLGNMNRNNLFYFFAILSLLLTSSINAQDLIVTSNGDSLNCKITRSKPNLNYYTFKYEVDIKSTMIPIDQVVYSEYNFPADVDNKTYPRWRLGLTGGWSTRTAKIHEDIPAEFESHAKELKTGYHIGGDITFYTSKYLGIGMKYDKYRTKNETDVYVTQQLWPSSYMAKSSEDITITFIGPFVSGRILHGKNKNSLFANLGAGYVKYVNESSISFQQNITSTGNLYGLNFDLGYDISLSKRFAIGFQLSFLTGVLKKYEVNIGRTTRTVKYDKNNGDDLRRINLSLGLRIL